MIASVLVSSFSQVMLKKSSQREYKSKIQEYVNPLVIIAYVLFFICTFITIYALKVIPLSMSPILEAFGYIFVAILSYFFFHEKLNKKQVLGIMLIVVGALVCTIKI